MTRSGHRASIIPHYEVGGDYYDFLTLSDTYSRFLYCRRVRKGDVSRSSDVKLPGKPESATSLPNVDLEVLLRKLNTLVVINSAGECFITLFIARYQHENQSA